MTDQLIPSGNEQTAERYLTVINHELQYSIWPAWKPVPAGWREVMAGSKEQCLEYIKQNWTDMRPLSLRRAMGDAPSDVAGEG
jgi:MbtH protein